jgi:hypothetical protein
MIGFMGTSVTVTLNYNHLWQLTINDCLRVAPFPPGLRAYSASVVRWLTIRSWTLNFLTNESSFTTPVRMLAPLRMSNELFNNSRRTKDRTLPLTVHAVRRMSIPRQHPVVTDMWLANSVSEPLPNNRQCILLIDSVTSGTCLPSRCPAMDGPSCDIILAFSRHIRIL